MRVLFPEKLSNPKTIGAMNDPLTLGTALERHSPLTGYADHVRQFLLRDLGPSLSVFVRLRDRRECTSQPFLAGIQEIIGEVLYTVTPSSIKDEMKASQTSTSLWSMCSIVSGSILTARTSVTAIA